MNVDPPPLGETLRPLAVLVIASEPGIRQFVSIILQRDGYAVLEASRGRDGLLQLHQQHPDLVVIDEELDLSGWQVLAGIRESSDAPVLLLTTPNTDSDRLANLDRSKRGLPDETVCPSVAPRKTADTDGTNPTDSLITTLTCPRRPGCRRPQRSDWNMPSCRAWPRKQGIHKSSDTFPCGLSKSISPPSGWKNPS